MKPLADRIRPMDLGDFIGQEHLVGKNKPLRLAIEKGEIHSMIFWGPPGSGKTTLARIIANEIQADFHHLSAVSAGKDDVRKIVKAKTAELEQGNLFNHSGSGRPRPSGTLSKGGMISLGVERGKANSKEKMKQVILFLDEIHRFNKAQQDYLLPYVEDGTIILIGATTENPSFEVIAPLLSRCQVFVLNELSEPELEKIVERGVREFKLTLSKSAKDFIISFANGDARQALNLLEATVKLYGKRTPGVALSDSSGKKRRKKTKFKTSITVENLKNTLQSKFLRYDRAGEEHYNTISSFIKSMRASNVDAAFYYLARMVDAGEDPLFIARRMVIFASEDIGMAQPTALVVANEVFKACETIGYPECAINLAHGTVYLASAKKDRSAYEAYFRAVDDVKKHGNLPIPLNLRNPVTKLMKDIGYGSGYNKYSKEDLLPKKLKGRKYYKKK